MTSLLFRSVPGRQPADLLGGQRQRPLRGLELLPQPDVLLGQLAVLGPRRGQLVLQAADRFLQHQLIGVDRLVHGRRSSRTVRQARLRFGRRQSPDDLHQQAPRQFVVVEPGRSRGCRAGCGDPSGTRGRRASTHPSGNPGGRPRRPGAGRAEADPVRPLAPDLTLYQSRTFHTRQQLRERHARTRVADGGGQLRAGHPVGVEELARFCQVRDDALTRPHRPFSDSLMPDPHVSTFPQPWQSRLPTIS